MMTNWDPVWHAINSAFQWLLAEVARVNAEARSDIKRQSTDFYVFRAYLAFRRRPGREEDLVVSVDCMLEKGGLYLTSDIATGSGHVLADGPSTRISSVDASDTPAPGVMVWVNSVVDFIKSHRELVCQQLIPEGPDGNDPVKVD